MATPQPHAAHRSPTLPLLSCLLRSVVVEGKNANAAFVPFRLVNYLCPAPASLAAAVADVAELICQEDKYEASEWLQPLVWCTGTVDCGVDRRHNAPHIRAGRARA